ncbi:SMC-Scp complex subunit ScpB [Acetobacter sicerae]|uniref:SMC-Scp complex subunit ScpB n=1 Tax=Acetobacter sicerae TaxID=85325 RepID=A0ABS8VTL3_9PROT|nr:SMC-Scp complex subunit ScpB [Acetobacter sicerae]MCE0742340.1 SMC-Scp complex subunit ScpB [Acetobacter sicerae]
MNDTVQSPDEDSVVPAGLSPESHPLAEQQISAQVDVLAENPASEAVGSVDEKAAVIAALIQSERQSPARTTPSDEAVRLVEAMIFASTDPVSARAVLGLLEGQGLIPDAVDDIGAYVRAVLASLVSRYEGRGVVPVEVAGGWQFRTAADLAPRLTRVMPKPRRLQRATMETLAIIAYHQPCTRAEIEEIRGVSVNQNTLDTLIEESLIAPRGRKEVPGRPVLWGTTPDFLRHFGLKSLNDLPRREELMGDMPTSPRRPAENTADLLAPRPTPVEEAEGVIVEEEASPAEAHAGLVED